MRSRPLQGEWLIRLCVAGALVACGGDVEGGDTVDGGEARDSGEVADLADLAEVADAELDEDGADAEGAHGDDGDDGDEDIDDDGADGAVKHPCPEWAAPPDDERLWGPEEIAPLALRLPTPDGVEVVVTQGNDGEFSHVGDQRFAWDFGMPYGTSVHAAATGIVVWVEDGRVGAGAGPEWRELANFAVLDHGGGLFTSYVHLALDSARAMPGDVVEVGEVLAETGESGQLTGPHLHFQVENVWSESVPAVFARLSACDWVPVAGERLTAMALPFEREVQLSELPEETFAEDGVVDVEGLPARLLSREAPYPIRGRAPSRGATEVYFMVLPPEGGTAVFAQRFAVAANRWFEGDLDLSELEAGQYGVALVAGSGQAVRVPRSVRAALVE